MNLLSLKISYPHSSTLLKYHPPHQWLRCSTPSESSLVLNKSSLKPWECWQLSNCFWYPRSTLLHNHLYTYHSQLCNLHSSQKYPLLNTELVRYLCCLEASSSTNNYSASNPTVLSGMRNHRKPWHNFQNHSISNPLRFFKI